jgi:hypothetical protein
VSNQAEVQGVVDAAVERFGRIDTYVANAIVTVYAETYRYEPEELRRVLDREGATVFTTELLAEHAPTLAELDRLGGSDPFMLFFEPPSLDDRIVNQSAVLSVLSDPAADLDDWIEVNPDAWHAWRITAEGKADIRDHLDQGGVNERVLMPGLDGLAAWLRRYYVPVGSGRGPLEGGAAMTDPIVMGTSQGEQESVP